MLEVDPSNADQAKAWDGDEGAYWAAHAEHFDRSLADYQPAFLDAAAVTTGDRVLDVGCGTGEETRAAARSGAADALGVDLSSEMVAVARRLAADEGLTTARFEQADAQIAPFPDAGFDTVVSRTSAMFFGDQPAAFANLARALRPGGRMVLLVWQPFPRNEWIATIGGAMAAGRDLPPPPPDKGPFSLSDPDRVRPLLTTAGFTDVDLGGLEVPMWFGHDADDACGFVLGLLSWMLEGLDEEGRQRAQRDLRAAMDAHAGPDGVTLGSAAWLITATRG
jgi:SAM-dependent methyltransferase